MSLLQRCAAHLQSKVDVKEAMDFGKYALKFALEGKTDQMVGIKVLSNRPYRFKYIPIPLEKVANGVKEVDKKYLNEENGSIKPLYLTYINKFMD
jgi:6-phosphofructokinase 1